MNSTIENREVGIIVSVYNAEKYVSQALDSLFNQEFPHEKYFVIAIDDGSVDSTPRILNSYKKNNNFILLTNEKNNGLVFSLNRALSLIKPKFILRFDADDIALPNLLSELYANIAGCAFCHPYMYIFYDENLESRFIYRVLALPYFFGSGVLFKYDVVSRYKYSNIFWEEFDLYLKILENGEKYKICQIPLLNHRVHRQNVTGDKEKFNQRYQELCKKWGKGLLNNYNLTLESLYQSYGYYFRNKNALV